MSQFIVRGRTIQEEETASANTLECRRVWQAPGIELSPGVQVCLVAEG